MSWTRYSDILVYLTYYRVTNVVGLTDSDCIQVYGVSEMDDTKLLIGRPYGSCIILINDELK